MTPPTRFDTATVLEQLATARAERDNADRLIRLLVAYARTQIRPCPYTLTALAAAVGMSTSGVRGCYDTSHVAAVRELINPNRATSRTEPHR